MCQDGGTAPPLTHLVLDALTTGNDDPEFNECFNLVDVDLGEGTNTRATPPPDATAAYSTHGGSGPDTVAVDGVASSGMHINANLGGGNDSFFGGDGKDVAHGGEGNDTLNASAGNDQHYGEGGNDEIQGGAGNDIEDGGAGDDTSAGSSASARP